MVVYDANGATGGVVPTDTTRYEAGQTVTVLVNSGTLVKTANNFAGWNTAADGSGTDLAAGSTFTMGGADVTLYAKWTSAVGELQTFTVGVINFNMSFVPGYTGFPTGTDDLGTVATVASPYWMSETEVTYELWHTVRTWAGDEARGANKYTFANLGREGHDGTDGAEPTPANQEPVTQIQWRDALVWCNALTEWYNANNGSEPDLDLVYYTDAAYTSPLRTATDADAIDPNAGSEDLPYIKAAAAGNTDPEACTAKGFRLPGNWEWELAARWRTDANNTVATFSNPWFTKGDSASGATAYYGDTEANGAVAWYNENSGLSTHAVKGKTANSLGLYDMSGNVWEWCFDREIEGSSRVLRGGSWYFVHYTLQVGHVYSEDPYYKSNSCGLRFARTP
jgi:formylglycine-generating enzyme required for sulfatase activity